MPKVAITIARQYGSGGREIGEKLSKMLGIPLIDKEIIFFIHYIKKTGICKA